VPLDTLDFDNDESLMSPSSSPTKAGPRWAAKKERAAMADEALTRLRNEVQQQLYETNKSIFQDFHFRKCMVRCFLGMQPWLGLMHLSIRTSAAIRALLLCARVLGALMANALFFATSPLDGIRPLGDANPEECDPSGFWDKVGMDFAVGTLSFVVAFVPVFLLAVIHHRDFVFVEKGDNGSVRRQLRLWWYQDFLLWLLGAIYVLACALFCAVFIANVSSTDSAHWMVSSFATLLNSVVLFPLVLSFLLTVVTQLLVLSSNDWTMERTKSRLGLKSSQTVMPDDSWPIQPEPSQEEVAIPGPRGAGLGEGENFPVSLELPDNRPKDLPETAVEQFNAPPPSPPPKDEYGATYRHKLCAQRKSPMCLFAPGCSCAEPLPVQLPKRAPQLEIVDVQQ